MNELVKMANIAKVKANLAAGMPMMAAIKKAYPDYTPDQVKALAAQMGGMGKTAGYGKSLKKGKAKKYMKKKLAHALMLKIANERTPRIPPPLLPQPKPAPKPKVVPGPGLKLVGRTRGTPMRDAQGNTMGPVGRPIMVGGGDPIYKKVPRVMPSPKSTSAIDSIAKTIPVKPKLRSPAKMPTPANNLKAKYVKN